MKKQLHKTLEIELNHDPQNGKPLLTIIKDDKEILLNHNEVYEIIKFYQSNYNN